jgi:hypothetical protein
MSFPFLPEIFEPDTEFDRVFNRLLINHSSNPASDSIEVLLQDLVNHLSCLAAALLRCERTPTDKQSLFIYPPGTMACSLVNSLLDTPALVQAIERIVINSSPESITQQISSEELRQINDNWPFRQVDLIPLPRSQKSTATNVTYLFMLVDADKLASSVKPKERRDIQRLFITQFLAGWWIRTTHASAGRVSEIQLSQLYNYTISELLDVGIQSAPFIRRLTNNDDDYIRYFSYEDEFQQFDWKKWIPLLSLKDNNLSEYQCRGELLAYFCRWIDSHNDLKKEQATLVPTSNNNKLNVTHWVQMQHENALALRKKLSSL